LGLQTQADVQNSQDDDSTAAQYRVTRSSVCMRDTGSY